jgi:hypothetical protein
MFDQVTWLHLVHELLLAIHKGLRNAQLASPNFCLANAFTDLDGPEGCMAGCIYDVLSSLTHFFWSDNEDNTPSRFLKTHCFQCIKSADIPPLPDHLWSIQLTTELDCCHVCKTLLNGMVQEVHHEVDEWHAAQCTALIGHIMELISGDPSATPASLSLPSLKQIHTSEHGLIATPTRCIPTSDT